MIGQYVVRCAPNGSAVTLAHLIESEVADRVVCRCGRFMARRTRAGTLRNAGGADRTCFFCAVRAAPVGTHSSRDASDPSDEGPAVPWSPV